MPLVLTQNEETESGHDYRDVLGLSYEFPRRYKRLVVSGTPFVYYRGRRRQGGRTGPQLYLGQGKIGEVTQSRDGLLKCSIEAFQPFEPPVPFKVDGVYLERRAAEYGSKSGLYFAQACGRSMSRPSVGSSSWPETRR